MMPAILGMASSNPPNAHQLLPLVLGIFLFAFTVYPKEALQDLFEMDLDDLLAVKVEIASRSGERQADAPSSVSVFSRAEIERMGITTLEELLNLVPGFYTSRTDFTGEEWALGTRGFWGISDSVVLLLIDGMRINEHYSGSFSFMDRLISLGAVERVEIIRGPGSALYGSNAYMGVINIITTDSTNQVRVEGGANRSRDIGVNWSHDFSKSLAAVFVREFSDTGQRYEDIFDPLGIEKETRDPRAGMDGYLTLAAGPVSLRLRYQERDLDDFFKLGHVANDINRSHTEASSFLLSYDFLDRDDWQGSASVGLAEYHERSLTRMVQDGTGTITHGDLLFGVVQEHRLATASVDMSTSFGEHHRFSYGLEAQFADMPKAFFVSNYDVLDFSLFLGRVTEQDTEEKRFLPEKQRLIEGLYLQDRFTYRDRLTIFAGLRYDHYNDFGSSVNPRTALILETGRGGRLKLMAGQAFLAPSLSLLYLKNTPFNVGNPDLQPQKIRTYEVAYIQEASGFRAALTLFFNDERGVFQLSTNDDGAFTTINKGRRQSSGLELELDGQFGDHILVRGSYSKVLDGEQPEAAAELASLMVNGRFGAFNLNLSGYYRGPSEILPEQAGFAIINGSFSWDAADHWSLFLRGENLFDERYVTYTPSSPVPMPSRGRELYLGVRIDF